MSIALSGVDLERGERQVLTGIDLTLTERRIGIVGANGSGKSSLARLFNGLLLPTRGAVTVDGLSTKTDGAEVRRRVGFVFQNPDNQIVLPTVGEDLAFGLKNLAIDQADLAPRIEAALKQFGIADLQTRLTHQLSEGEKQLVAIAGVTVMQPARIVLDEPTTLLDLGNKKRVMQAIDGLPQSVILISHDLDLLRSYERIICIDGGRVAADGLADEVLPWYRRMAS